MNHLQIQNITTGKVYSDIYAALKDYMCPGLCKPSCPLCTEIRLPNGIVTHKCDRLYVKDHQAEILNAINCKIVA